MVENVVAINLKAPETEALLRQIAELTGDSLTQAAHRAFERRLEELQQDSERERKKATRAIREIVSLARSLPILDQRSSKEISDWLWEDA